jgi:hypothetical protein
MRRWPLTILALLSLLLCCTVAALWARSYFHSDLVYYTRHRPIDNLTFLQNSYQFSSSNGGLAIAAAAVEFTCATPEESARVRQQSGYVFDGEYRFAFLEIPWKYYGGAIRAKDKLRFGFGYHHFDTRTSGFRQPLQVGSSFVLPWPFLFLVFAILPAVHLTLLLQHRRRARRRKSSLCVNCGYDVRATPERCPECGSAPVAKFT